MNCRHSTNGLEVSIRNANDQGDRAGVPLARHDGERRVRDNREIATAEKINESYVGRVLRLTLLAPDIVEAILGGRQPAELQLEHLLRRFPVGWVTQRALFLGCA